MELREFAERILFSESLEDKLFVPTGPLTDAFPGKSIEVPIAPARSNDLAFATRRSAGSKARFPALNALETDHARAAVLHFFANHELLALELMALALLRFVDAPAPFRFSIAQTMFEEQSHMKLYIDRIGELGMRFGELPVNDFFWRVLKSMAHPIDYVTQMSMTLEQANVDYAAHYRDIFRVLGDTTTAAILNRVYLEEIGHVKAGVVWFERWRPHKESLWQEWCQKLTFPMTPSRAKGIGFDREGRLKAGLDEEFINRLALWSQSKGRPPDVFSFNPDFETAIDSEKPHGAIPRSVVADLAPLMTFLCRHGDLLECPVIPTASWQSHLAARGIEMPIFVSEEELRQNIKSLAPTGIRDFRPWGLSPSVSEGYAWLVPHTMKGRQSPDQVIAEWRKLTALLPEIVTRGFAATLRKDLSQELLVQSENSRVLAHSIDELPSMVVGNVELQGPFADFLTKGFHEVVAKPLYSSSGRGLVRIKESKDLERLTSNEFHQIVVEPWVRRIADFSIQMHITAAGEIIEKGIVRQICDHRGAYKGHLLGKSLAGLPALIVAVANGEANAAHGMPISWFSSLRQIGHLVAVKLRDRGFRGPFGIDAFAWTDVADLPLSQIPASRIHWRPLSEINARFTMGRIAVALEKKLKHGNTGIWRHFSQSEMKKAGFNSVREFAQSIERRVELQDQNESLLFTNDPLTATSFLTIMVQGPTLASCLEVLGLNEQFTLLPSNRLS